MLYQNTQSTQTNDRMNNGNGITQIKHHATEYGMIQGTGAVETEVAVMEDGYERTVGVDMGLT